MTRNVDDFLIKLVSDISAIKTTISSLESQLAKYEDKLLGPFQEIVHNVKTLENDFENLAKEVEKLRDEDIKALSDSDRTKSTEITTITNRLDATKWYIAGGLAVATTFLGIIYQIISFAASIYFK